MCFYYVHAHTTNIKCLQNSSIPFQKEWTWSFKRIVNIQTSHIRYLTKKKNCKNWMQILSAKLAKRFDFATLSQIKKNFLVLWRDWHFIIFVMVRIMISLTFYILLWSLLIFLMLSFFCCLLIKFGWKHHCKEEILKEKKNKNKY